MAQYDKELDKVIATSETMVDDVNKIVVSCCSYNEGVAKIQIQRMTSNKDGEWSHRKLGRLGKAETQAVITLLDKMKEHL